MIPLYVTALVIIVAGLGSFGLFRYCPPLRFGPRIDSRTVRNEVRKHPRLAGFVSARLDPSALTGLALTVAGGVAVVGVVFFGLVFFMIRRHFGFADFDVSAARFAAGHATHGSTTVLRIFTQLGGAVVLVPLAVVVWLTIGRRRGLKASFAFLVLTVGGQFAVADLVKWIVDRTRPNFDRLTGFSGPSFPSGHATASACCLAAFVLLAGVGRSPRAQAVLGAVAVALAAGISSSRVFLGVHWLTDVIGGLVLGWTWFALCSIAFGGRLLDFARPAEEIEQTVEAEQRSDERSAAAKASREGLTRATPTTRPGRVLGGGRRPTPPAAPPVDAAGEHAGPEVRNTRQAAS